MINEPKAGQTPWGLPITEDTPDRPGIFLSREAARNQLSEYPKSERRKYRIMERGVRAAGWNMTLWIAVVKDGETIDHSEEVWG